VEIPTSSGKTWIFALLAKNFIDMGQRVTILEPNEELRN
jgi:superfamily II DNA or RNA helicase